MNLIIIIQITLLPKVYNGIDIHKRSWKVHYTRNLFLGKSFITEVFYGNLLAVHIYGHRRISAIVRINGKI
ncbi:hypothetical protein [Arenibacter algicola]|uniref:hypothetical protein n=1 Tax=Arenibacter algicola TaxID=616991 RepID=UPI00114DF83F